MVSEIRTKDGSENSISITLASLANNAGRCSASISNSTDQPAAIVSLKITSGSSAPNAGAVYRVYLLRDTGTLADDGWAGSDAAFTPLNAPLLGTIEVTASASTAFYGIFDTSPLGPLGPTWGIAIYNASGQALDSTEGNHAKYYFYYVPEIQ